MKDGGRKALKQITADADADAPGAVACIEQLESPSPVAMQCHSAASIHALLLPRLLHAG